MTSPPPVAAAASPLPSPLVARTVEVDDPGPLLALLHRDTDAVAWVHHGDGLVGWGRAASLSVDGPDRFDRAHRWWREVTRHSVTRDEVHVPGSGLVGWVTVVGTSISSPPSLTPTDPPQHPHGVELVDGSVDSDAWQDVVAEAVRRISAGQLDKGVLARDLVAELDTPLDVRSPLRRLARDYPGCWTFHVDGFFGSTPEMLVRLERGLVTSRVLAGTIRRTGDDTRDLALAASLARSSKDLEEHEYAVRSVAEALAPHCSSTNVPDAPFVLHLPNVMHLATDVTAVLRGDASALNLVAALHPSAAVGGTPTDAAVALIAEIEGLDRGRYAGPVGWIGAEGDGEWGIGLRSAQLEDEGRRVRLFAGCGIVADSVPADELAESQAKLVPVRDALA